MHKRRRYYTHPEAQAVLVDYVRRRFGSTTEFHAWLEEHGIAITRTYCDAMIRGRLTPGPKFKQVFEEVTGIRLVDGLVEVSDDR
jgi:hypothetical protein